MGSLKYWLQDCTGQPSHSRLHILSRSSNYTTNCLCPSEGPQQLMHHQSTGPQIHKNMSRYQLSDLTEHLMVFLSLHENLINLFLSKFYTSCNGYQAKLGLVYELVSLSSMRSWFRGPLKEKWVLFYWFFFSDHTNVTSFLKPNKFGYLLFQVFIQVLAYLSVTTTATFLGSFV